MDYVVRRCRFVFLIAPTVVLLAVSTVLVCLPAHADEAAANLFSEDYKQWVQEVDDGLFSYDDFSSDEYVNSMYKNLLDENYMKDCYYHPDARPAPTWYLPEQAVSEGYTSFYYPLSSTDTFDHVVHPETRKMYVKDFADSMAGYFNKQAKVKGYYAAAPTKSERMLNVGKFEDAGRLGMTSSQIEAAEKAGVKAETVINATTGAKTASETTVKESMKASAAVLEKKGFSKAEAWAAAKTVGKYAGKGLMTGLRFADNVTNVLGAQQLGVWVGNGIVHLMNIDQQTECSTIRNGFAQLALGIGDSCEKFKATPEQLALHAQYSLGKNSTCFQNSYVRVCFVGYALGRPDDWSDDDRNQGVMVQSVEVVKDGFRSDSGQQPSGVVFSDSCNPGSTMQFFTGIGFDANLPVDYGAHLFFDRVDPTRGLQDKPWIACLGDVKSLAAYKIVNPDGTDADAFHLDVHRTDENAQVCTLVELEDGSNHIACGGKIMDAPSSTGTGTEKTIAPPSVPITPDSDTAAPSNVKNVKVFVLHDDGTRTDIGGGPVTAPSEGYLDLWDRKANVSCFEAGEACADWATGVKDATGEALTTKNQHTTKTDPKLDYECRWYEPDGKTYKQLPIGECTVYKTSFVQKNQAEQRPYTDPSTGETTEDATIPKSMVAPKFDFSNCIREKVATNPVSWVMRPVACALEWAFVPDPTVMTTQVARIRERTGGVGSTLETAFRQHYMVFGKQQADCKGPEFSLAFRDVQIIPPSYPMSVCKGSGLEFLPTFSKAAFTALYGYACLLVLRKWFFGISGFNPDSLGKEEGKK